jgi:hypothetical protein
MHLNRTARWTTEYRVKTSGTAAPDLLLEQQRRSGAALTAPDPKSVELAAGVYRIPLTLAATGEARLSVVEEQPVEEAFGLADLDDNRLGVFVASTELDPKVRQALGALATRRQAVAHQRADLDRLKEQRRQLVEDESRLRSNIAVLGADPALRKSQLDKFNETETAIETTTAATAKATDALSAAERDLASYVANLKL